MSFEELSSSTSFLTAIGRGFKDIFGGSVQDIAESIVEIDRIFSRGTYMSVPPRGYINSIADNIMDYQKLADSIKTMGLGTDIENVNNVAFGMASLAVGFDSLGNGIAKLNNEIERLNLEKLNALKSLTGSIILMSLMDSNQFNSMMDALEKKAKVFVDVMNELSEEGAAEAGKRTKGGPTLTMNLPGGERSGKTIDDIINAIEITNVRLSQVVQSNENISNYVNQLKAGTFNLGK
jgi:hypothetical protein